MIQARAKRIKTDLSLPSSMFPHAFRVAGLRYSRTDESKSQPALLSLLASTSMKLGNYHENHDHYCRS